MSSKSGTRHYTQAEKKIFLDILKSYSATVENKKSDATSLKEKESAWMNIAGEFNTCHGINGDRTIPHLKKLWQNLKQQQRDALTKERQARMATGGGPQPEAAPVDPDVAAVAPHLIVNPTVLFSSNMSLQELMENREAIAAAADVVILQDPTSDSRIGFVNMDTISDNGSDSSGSSSSDATESGSGRNVNSVDFITPLRPGRGRKRSLGSCSGTSHGMSSSVGGAEEKELRLERLQKIMKQEEELAGVRKKGEVEMYSFRLRQEEILAQLRFRQEEELGQIKLQHMQEVHKLEMRVAIAKAELAEGMLTREKINV